MSKVKKIMVAVGVIAGAATIYKVAKSIKRENERLSKDNEYLEACARTDELTGLRNRYALREDFDQYREKEVSVVLMDIDSFKEFNDTNGHEFGDDVLRDVASRSELWLNNANCYRYGGDEFLFIAPGIEENEMNSNMESLQLILDTPAEEIGVPVGISYGCVYGKVNSSEDHRKLIHKADEQLYEVKAQKGCVR